MKAARYPLLAVLFAPLLVNAEATRTLQEVTVTASSDATEERRAAVTQKTVLDQTEIQALGGLTVGEVIRKLPGIEAGAHTGDSGPTANARGMGRDAVQFLIDGERPSANARYALTTVGRLPSGELERIEILRGASAEHGGSAPVTVNLVMKKARPQASRTFKAALGTRGDEANGQFSGSLGGGEQGFSWILPLTVNHHGMPFEKTSRRQAATGSTRTLWQEEQESGAYQLDEFILSPRLTWRAASSSLTLWPSLYHNQGEKRSTFTRQAYADPAAGTGLAADGGRREDESSQLTIARLRGEGETKISDGKLSGRAAVMEGRRRSTTDRQWRTAAGTSSAAREALARDETEISSALRIDRSAGQGVLSGGLEQGWLRRVERQDVSGSGAYGSRHDAEAQQWTAWVQHEWAPLKALTLTGGLRGEQIRLESDGRRKIAGQLAPSLAGRLEIAPDLILRSSLGAGIKAPKLDEISGLSVRNSGANSPLEADRAGNPDLVAERNINWEVAIDKHLPNEAGTLGANIYLRRTENFIERRTQLEAGRWVDRPYNEGSARHYGLELDAKLQSTPFGFTGGTLRSHLTLPHGRVDDERLGQTRDARDLPRYQFTLGYDHHLPWLQSTAGFQLNQFGATRSAIADELSTRQKARTLLDLYLVRRLTPQLNLRCEAQNLLRADTERLAESRQGADSWQLGSAERGQRTLMVSLEGKW